MSGGTHRDQGTWWRGQTDGILVQWYRERVMPERAICHDQVSGQPIAPGCLVKIPAAGRQSAQPGG